MDILDPALLLENLDGDRELLAEIIWLFLESSRDLHGALRQAVSRGDTDAVHRSAHQLKGALANVGAQAATHAAQQLETLGRRRSMAGLEDALFALEHELGRLKPALEELVRSDT
ncbi:MAG: Hpt domain-containing protein [Candidatus Eiseniibacteriota bacterium]